MVKIKLFKNGKIVKEASGIMLDLWKDKELEPDLVAIEIRVAIKPTERVWLSKILDWVYEDNQDDIAFVNGEVVYLNDFKAR